MKMMKATLQKKRKKKEHFFDEQRQPPSSPKDVYRKRATTHRHRLITSPCLPEKARSLQRQGYHQVRVALRTLASNFCHSSPGS